MMVRWWWLDNLTAIDLSSLLIYFIYWNKAFITRTHVYWYVHKYLQYVVKYIKKQKNSIKYKVYKQFDELNFNYSGFVCLNVALLQFGTFCDRLSSVRTNTSLLSQNYVIAAWTLPQPLHLVYRFTVKIFCYLTIGCHVSLLRDADCWDLKWCGIFVLHGSREYIVLLH